MYIKLLYHGRPVRLGCVFLVLLAIATSGWGQTIWNGPTTNFTDSPGSDPTQPANQDRITSNTVWITRATTEGIYNAAQETGYDKAGRTSPVDTEWASGTLNNYASLAYTSWYNWEKPLGGPPSSVGHPAVLHLISENIYIAVTFTSWGGSGGGFSYQRSTAPAVSTPPTVSITSPSAGAVFAAPATFPITATASSSSGTIASVQFLVNGSGIGTSTTAPYSATASNLASGAYTLSAIATDNNGLKATNSIQVTVTLPPTIWSGPTITFSNTPGSDPAQPASQDRITAGVWITRGPTMGIYNAAQETNFTASVSPADTQWAYGFLTNYASLNYTNWNTWAHAIGNSPTNTVGQPAVMHLVAENIYLAVTFTFWGMSTNSFAYQRSTAPGVIVTNNIVLSSPAVVGGQFQFVVSGLVVGKTNFIQASSNLSSAGNWISIATNVAAATNLNVSGLSATNAPFRFFRVLQSP